MGHSHGGLTLLLLLSFSLSFLNGGGGRKVSSAVAFAAGPMSGDGSASASNLGTEHDYSRKAEIPLLPAGDPDKNLPSIKLGETISFEEIGPIILNADGTTRRISNWADMTISEQQATWRRIKKRNEERRIKLLKEQAEEMSPSDSTQEL